MRVIVIGAGVVGLACAATLARRGTEVWVLERHPEPGRETSSRNSEVIHAGIYYPEGSRKAETCVEGRERLYARCARDGIPHRKLGKLVVATSDAQVETLETLACRGRTNGAGALEVIEAARVQKLEPRVRAVAGLWSPESGIVDAHALMSSYQAEAEAHGAQVVTQTRVCGLERTGDGWRVATRDPGGEPFDLAAEWVVNSAGLAADRVAELAGVDVDACGYRLHPCKGDYFSVAPRLGPLASHLIYPVPAQAGLGIHVTLDLGGRYRLGPDTEYVPEPRYDVDPAKAQRFAAAVQSYLPEIEARDLEVDFAGVRPKLAGPGDGFRDFVIDEASALGAPGLVNLIGIESPGLTAAGAIAERVATLVGSS